MDQSSHSSLLKKFPAALIVLAFALALTAPKVPAQTRPRFADYFTEIPVTTLDAGYAAVGGGAVRSAFEDLDGDGHQDLIVLGWEHPAFRGVDAPFAPRPGRVFLGDGNGHFAAAPAALFPVDTLQTINCEPFFADFNGDSRPDMFLTCAGWDVFNDPGEQNRLYLSWGNGGWRDATENLPQLIDRSNAGVGIGDIRGSGFLDIFVGNGNAGLNRILSYTLLNIGNGQFTRTSTNIPVRPGQLLDPYSGGYFFRASLIDLNGDGRPELIVGGTPQRGAMNLPRKPLATILWNRGGVFVETDITALPAPAGFPTTHGEAGFKGIDVNQDGLQDLVAVGNQNPLQGWYLQIFVNQGNGRFVDETADRVPQGEASGGIEGVETTAVREHSPGPLHILDFNQDGAPDIYVAFRGTVAAPLTPGQPLIWLNDGTGHFSTLKVGDFVPAGRETQSPNNLVGSAHLVATRNGYSFISISYNGRVVPAHPLTVTGLLATKPYRLRVFPLCLWGVGCSGLVP